MRFRRPAGWLTLLIVGIAVAVAYAVVPYSTASELVLYDGGVLLAVVAGIVGLRRAWASRRGPWLAVAVGLIGFFVAELISRAYLMAGLDPFPSVADAVFIASYPLLAVAAALLARGADGEGDHSAWLDAGVLVLVAGVVMWALVGEAIAHDTASTALGRAVSLAYVVADLLILGLLLRLLLAKGARSGASTLFALGVAATFAADTLFVWLDLHGAYAPASVVDAGWIAGYVLMGVAAMHPGALRAPRPSETHGLGRGRLAMVLVALVVPLVVLGMELSDAKGLGLNTATVALVSAAGVMLLVACRLWGLLGRARRVEARRGAERLSALVHHSSDGILLVDSHLRVTFASPAAGGLSRIDPAGCIGRPLRELLVVDEDPGLRARLAQLLAAPGDDPLVIAGMLRTADGATKAFEGTARNLIDNPAVSALVVTLRDVTARRALEEELEHQAFHDDLTALANRPLFLDRVSHAIQRLQRNPDGVSAVVLIDLDDFKAVNDGMGHAAGDALLCEVATRLRSCVRPADTVARLGGDEFALLLEDLSSPGDAELLAARALEVLQLPLPVVGVELAVSASAGVALPTPACTVDTVLRDADIAMYSAKGGGKARIALFDDALREEARHRLTLRVELPEALRLGQFRLEFQAIHRLPDEHLSGFEALLRWDHPERGPVPPSEFIPEVEASGLVVNIGGWVLREACAQAAAWNARAARPLTMNVNVSVVQLRQANFVDEVRSALRDSGLDPSLLILEVTESVLIEHGQGPAVLDELRALGVGIAIDDFGTGYSSLAYLRRLPVTSIKIDRAFVAEVDAGGDVSLVRSILALADALSLRTVAEGVETNEQLATLAALGCGYAQGFHLARPARPEHLEALVGAIEAIPAA